MKLWKVMNKQKKIRGLNNNQIVVYGELFGGEYPHPLVKPVKGVMSVQKGIYYCPDVEWKAFDIYDGEDFVEWDEMKDLLYHSHIPFIGELTRGPFIACKSYNPNFSTLIPQEFNLPSFQLSNFENNAEGIIIRPLKNLESGAGRVIFKIKTKDFDARTRENPKDPDFSTAIFSNMDDMYAGSTNSSSNKVKVKKTEPDMFLSFVNKNRLESVISKEGSLTRGNEEQFTRLLYEDAMKDVKKCRDMGMKFTSMSKRNKEQIRCSLLAESKKVVQKYIKDGKKHKRR